MRSICVCTWQKTPQKTQLKNKPKKRPQNNHLFFIEDSHKVKEGLPKALGRTKQTFVAYVTSLTEDKMLRQKVLQAWDVSTKCSANLGLFRAPGRSQLWSGIAVSYWMWYLLETQGAVSGPIWWIEMLFLWGFVLVGLWDKEKLSVEKNQSSLRGSGERSLLTKGVSLLHGVSPHLEGLLCRSTFKPHRVWVSQMSYELEMIFLCTSALACNVLSAPWNDLCGRSCWYCEGKGCPKGWWGTPMVGERGAHPKAGAGWAHCRKFSC